MSKAKGHEVSPAPAAAYVAPPAYGTEALDEGKKMDLLTR